jgi:DNA-binding PadR family transcriptional regulator
MKLSPSSELILRAIAHREMYGKEIARALLECCDRNIREGSLYPTLRSLHQKGLVSKRNMVVNGNNYDFYVLTDSGKKVLSDIEEGFEKLKNWERSGD